VAFHGYPRLLNAVNAHADPLEPHLLSEALVTLVADVEALIPQFGDLQFNMLFGRLGIAVARLIEAEEECRQLSRVRTAISHYDANWAARFVYGFGDALFGAMRAHQEDEGNHNGADSVARIMQNLRAFTQFFDGLAAMMTLLDKKLKVIFKLLSAHELVYDRNAWSRVNVPTIDSFSWMCRMLLTALNLTHMMARGENLVHGMASIHEVEAALRFMKRSFVDWRKMQTIVDKLISVAEMPEDRDGLVRKRMHRLLH
jgi:uncharacterized protein YjfI (DUF2170 family)